MTLYTKRKLAYSLFPVDSQLVKVSMANTIKNTWLSCATLFELKVSQNH